VGIGHRHHSRLVHGETGTPVPPAVPHRQDGVGGIAGVVERALAQLSLPIRTADDLRLEHGDIEASRPEPVSRRGGAAPRAIGRHQQ